MDNQKTLVPKREFTVLIDNREYDVYDIDGKEHNGYNNIPKTWWLYHSDRLAFNMTPPADSEYFIPYNSSILRREWELKIKQGTNSKIKWDEAQFSNYTSVEMWCNRKLIYSFSTSGNALDFALAKIQYFQVIISEHPYDFFNSEKEDGRKICFYGLPATIKNTSDIGIIKIFPDYTEGFDKNSWWKELENRKKMHKERDEFDDMFDEDFRDDMESGYIYWGSVLNDANIYWFRK